MTVTDQKIQVAIPNSVFANTSDLRGKTEKAFRLARALGMFRITTCWIYRSPFISKKQGERDAFLLKKILEYLEMPPYLRKHLLPHQNELKYIGAMGPLGIKTHSPKKIGTENEIREGVLYLVNKTPKLDIGLNYLVDPINPPSISLKNKKIRVTVQLKYDHDKKRFLGKILPPHDIKHYYRGYKVQIINESLGIFLMRRKKENFIITTSRHCESLKKEHISEIKTKKNLLIVFGGPYHGIHDILKAENKHVSQISNICVNVLKNHALKTLRLEEAVLITFVKLFSC